MRPSHRIQHNITRVVWQTDLFDHLATQYVAKETAPRRVLGNLKVTQGHIAFGKLGFEDVDERCR